MRRSALRPASPDRPSRYVTPRATRVVAWLVAALGLAIAVSGLVSAVNGTTQAGAAVTVPVELTDDAVQALGGEAGSRAVPLEVAGLPTGSTVSAAGEGLLLRAWDSTVAEQALARGDAVLVGLCAAVGGLLLRRLLLSVAAADPFDRRNPARLAWLGVLVAVAGLLSPLLPQLGAIAVLERLGLAGPDGPFVLGVAFQPSWLLLTPVLLALAEAFRRGRDLQQDVEGLV